MIVPHIPEVIINSSCNLYGLFDFLINYMIGFCKIIFYFFFCNIACYAIRKMNLVKMGGVCLIFFFWPTYV